METLNQNFNKKENSKGKFLEIKRIFEKLNNLNNWLKVATLASLAMYGINSKKSNVTITEYESSHFTAPYNVKYSKFFKKNNMQKFLQNIFIDEVALSMQGDNSFENKIRDSLFTDLYVQKGEKFTETQLLNMENNTKHYNNRIEEARKKLTEKDRKLAKEKIIKMINMVEQGKKELIKHVKSDEYLKKVMKEFNISEKEALRHQEIRISNIENVNYSFKSSLEIHFNYLDKEDLIPYAYYINNSNIIKLPYDKDLNNEKEKNFFYEAILHEILHEYTLAGAGMSDRSKILLTEGFKTKINESEERKEYFSLVAELIVRKQILDLEMEKLGIKKYGEEFNEWHYEILKILIKEGLLSTNATDFIEHIKSDKFIEIMNSLARVDDDGKTYYPKELWVEGGESKDS